jgi:hypothetical protein
VRPSAPGPSSASRDVALYLALYLTDEVAIPSPWIRNVRARKTPPQSLRGCSLGRHTNPSTRRILAGYGWRQTGMRLTSHTRDVSARTLAVLSTFQGVHDPKNLWRCRGSAWAGQHKLQEASSDLPSRADLGLPIWRRRSTTSTAWAACGSTGVVTTSPRDLTVFTAPRFCVRSRPGLRWSIRLGSATEWSRV